VNSGAGWSAANAQSAADFLNSLQPQQQLDRQSALAHE